MIVESQKQKIFPQESSFRLFTTVGESLSIALRAISTRIIEVPQWFEVDIKGAMVCFSRSSGLHSRRRNNLSR